MDKWKNRFMAANDILRELYSELSYTVLPSDIVAFVTHVMQDLVQLAVDTISHHSCVLESVRLKMISKTSDDLITFSLDEFVAAVVKFNSVDVYRLQTFLYDSHQKLRATEHGDAQRSLESEGGIKDSKYSCCWEECLPHEMIIGRLVKENERVPSQENCFADIRISSGKCLEPQWVQSKETRETFAACNYREDANVIYKAETEIIEEIKTETTEKGFLGENSETAQQNEFERKLTRASNGFNTSLKCFLCNTSDILYQSFHHLAQHVATSHTISAGDKQTILKCPRSSEDCSWQRIIRSTVSKSALHEVLNHLVTVHQTPVPDHMGSFSSEQRVFDSQRFEKYDPDQAIHENDITVSQHDSSEVVTQKSTSKQQRHTEVKLFSCEFKNCSKQFKSKYSLTRHTENVHCKGKKHVRASFPRSYLNTRDCCQNVDRQTSAEPSDLHCPQHKLSMVLRASLRRHILSKYSGTRNSVKATEEGNTGRCNENATELSPKLDSKDQVKNTGARDDEVLPKDQIKMENSNSSNCSDDDVIKSPVLVKVKLADSMEYDEEEEAEEDRVDSQLTESKSNIIRFLWFQCFLCSDSETEFASSGALFDHVRDEHVKRNGPANVLACPYCGDEKVFKKGICSSLLSRLLSHMVKKHRCAVPDYVKPFHCTESNCGFFSIRKYELNAHAEKQHKMEEKVPCDKCGKLIKQQSLATHAKFCSADAGKRLAFACSKCQKVMSTKQSLQKHFQTKHENRKDFLCSQCTRMFGGKGELEDHAFRRHGMNISNKPVSLCPHCSFATIVSFSLKRHIAEVHSDAKQHQCLVCNKFFKSKMQLKSHKVAHEERTHRCSMCEYTAARKSNLNAHIKAQHSGVQYKCEACGYQTGYYANLCKHKRLSCSRQRNNTQAVASQQS